MSGSILALKILTGTNTRVIFGEYDNKFLKNEGKTVSSSYPPRSSNSQRRVAELVKSKVSSYKEVISD